MMSVVVDDLCAILYNGTTPVRKFSDIKEMQDYIATNTVKVFVAKSPPSYYEVDASLKIKEFED